MSAHGRRSSSNYPNSPTQGHRQRLQGGVAAAMDHGANIDQREVMLVDGTHIQSKQHHQLNPRPMVLPAAGCTTTFDPPANAPLPPTSRNFAAPEPSVPPKASTGHYSLSGGTQNQGNCLGDRSCVRQSKLYRQYESGNEMKAIFGHDHLAWDTEKKQGAYAGQSLYDHNTDAFVPTDR